MFRYLKELSQNQIEEYPGNIWGWRTSLIGLVLILGLLGIMVYRHIVLDVPVGFEDPDPFFKQEQLDNKPASQE